MNSISSTSYSLPPPRPWDPRRRLGPEERKTLENEWIEGKVVTGHPNICPMLDFFEDDQYYYMVMPSLLPEPVRNEPAPPSDLFDLVEMYPQGLPAHLIRSYLGQIADAMAFLHSKGIGNTILRSQINEKLNMFHSPS
jgi:protein-serine/threonine kinase